ncbi:hypothetical protein E2C01_039218 [Portunus trituberculatus]|uniref:Uncharacterized protein n=1 Tax=Portunus trituberculatus TaxID=210409 RepID=A0A5B7FKT0_PORTR|nr:hypothetical protein [Portunus trituberculatus]
MDEKQKSVVEWCGRGHVATIRVSGGRRIILELPGNYKLEHQERRAGGELVLAFESSCSAAPPTHLEDAPGRETPLPRQDASEETGHSFGDATCVKLKVANNFRVKFPRSLEDTQGHE